MAASIALPFAFDARGRTAVPASDDAHIRDMIEAVLFTSPGERVNRPDFGSGLLQLVFEANQPEVAAALQFTVQAALVRWLGDVIAVERLEVTSDDARLTVDLTWSVLRTGAVVTASFDRSVA